MCSKIQIFSIRLILLGLVVRVWAQVNAMYSRGLLWVYLGYTQGNSGYNSIIVGYAEGILGV